MALAKLAQGIESIRGSFAGQYFKKDNAGQHIVAKRMPVHKEYANTTTTHNGLEFAGRGALTLAFTKVSELWKALCLLASIPLATVPYQSPIYYKILDAIETLKLWEAFAAATYLIGGAGIKYLIHARQWYLKANTARNAINLEPINDPYLWHDFFRYLNYNVRNTIWHEIDGIWSEEGTHILRPFYRLDGKPWFLWCKDFNAWYISEFPGVVGTSGWKWEVPTQQGEYKPYGTAEGVFTVWPIKKYKYVD